MECWAAEKRLMDIQQGKMFACENVCCVVCSLFHLGFACLHSMHTFFLLFFIARYYLKTNKTDMPARIAFIQLKYFCGYTEIN